MASRPVIIAHRTCPLDAPENSLEGMAKAAAFGSDGVEIDVRLSLDGVPVLMHDWSLRRTTGFPGPVRLYPWFLLRRIRLKYGNECIPSFAQALDALPDGLVLALEIKDAAAAPKSLELIRERGLESRVLLWSYREHAVRHFSEHGPEVEPSLLRDDIDPEGLQRYLQDATDFGARGLSPHWSAISPQFVGEAHDRKLKVYSMNRGLESVVRKVGAGLDGIVTDNPREVREMLPGLAAAG
jgi:glycerophosphoryl diester phosphodiesterase